VLFIDEAQNLSDSALETVRLLSNFEASDRKLFQIILSGQSELARRLRHPGLAQLSQRIAVMTGLRRLPEAEVSHYIAHRLEVAGYQGPEIFTPAAVALIAQRSQGIPRNINNICFNAMSLACATQQKRIGPKVVREALSDLSPDWAFEQPCTYGPITPTVASKPFSLRWIKDNVVSNRTAQTAVLSALLGSWATYFGAHGTSTVHSSPLSDPGTVNAENIFGPASSSDRAVINRASGSPPTNSSDASDFFTYVVRRDDTIWELCVRSLGRYDDAVVAELRRLNPNLIDFNRIEIGQEIRLPRVPRRGMFTGETSVDARDRDN
jgi:AAA domain